jgi:hypothetical protein
LKVPGTSCVGPTLDYWVIANLIVSDSISDLVIVFGSALAQGSSLAQQLVGSLTESLTQEAGMAAGSLCDSKGRLPFCHVTILVGQIDNPSAGQQEHTIFEMIVYIGSTPRGGDKSAARRFRAGIKKRHDHSHRETGSGSPSGGRGTVARRAREPAA